jgi:hypothetical protein
MASNSSNVRVLARIRPAQPQEYQFDQAAEALSVGVQSEQHHSRPTTVDSAVLQLLPRLNQQLQLMAKPIQHATT